MNTSKQYFCIISPSGFRHITTNAQAVRDALTLNYEVWHNQKRIN